MKYRYLIILTGIITIVSLGWGIQIVLPIPSVFGLEENRTVPTRTSTPQPTATKSSGGGGNPPPTDTPVAEATATATATKIVGTLAPTPIGGFLPTAAPGSDQPTIQALNQTNARSGPGLEFETIYQLVFLEVRPIVGQSVDGEWWVIVLPDDVFGWVFKEIVTAQGNTDNVPVMTVEDLLKLTPPPTLTPSPIPTATNTAVPTNTHTPEPTATNTAVPPTDTPTVIPQRTRVGAASAPLPTAVPLENNSSSGNINWLLIGAGVLLLVGIGGFIISR
ncbi:MAG TPA: hypothetical protein EYP41_02220, partial [Anaerolineae bacterium]|nr:hypothetical protein [Anaerolineae bacterium]